MSPTIAGTRLVQQLQRQISHVVYEDKAYYYPPQSNEDVLDSYGHFPTPTEQSAENGVPCECSFNDTPAKDTWNLNAGGSGKVSQIEASAVEAEIRVAVPTPSMGGRFKIVKRFGIDVTPILYEVIGLRARGEFGYLCALKKAIV